MVMAEATTIGAVNAIAAAGMLASANAPPPSIPAQRHAIITCPPGDASAKKISGRVAHKMPSNSELRIARLIVCAETSWASYGLCDVA